MLNTDSPVDSDDGNTSTMEVAFSDENEGDSMMSEEGWADAVRAGSGDSRAVAVEFKVSD